MKTYPSVFRRDPYKEPGIFGLGLGMARLHSFARIGFLVVVAIALDASLLGPGIAAPPDDKTIASREISKFFRTWDYRELRKIVGEWKRQDEVVQKHIVLFLIDNLGSPKALKLENYADMTVNSRVVSGKMECHGHGESLHQDVFIVNGRSAWALERLLDVRLPPFTENMKRADLDHAIRESRLIIDAR